MVTRALDHLQWPLGGIAGQRTRYSIRLLRYWFARSLLERLHLRLGRPLRILEVGVGGAELREFVGSPSWIERWDGLDVNAPSGKRARYDDFVETDVEGPLYFARTYDAVVLSHVLEHLLKPEAAMARLLDAVVEGGVMIGGSPTMPTILAVPREAWLRRKNKSVRVTEHRHLSVITPKRVSRFARDHALEAELITGTFFLRWSGFFLENFSSWIRANLAWGAVFPALGGELYFSLRKSVAARPV